MAPRAAVTVLTGLLTGVLTAAVLAPPPAGALTVPPAPSADLLSYDRVVTASALQPYARGFAGIADAGYTHVALELPRGGPPDCDASGAGVGLHSYDDHGFLVPANPGPHPREQKPRNPTEARQVRPLPPGAQHPGPEDVDWRDRTPVVSARGAGGPQWTAACAADGSAGRAAATSAGVAAYEAAGSVTAAALDHATGGYTGSARAFVQNLVTPGGTVGLVTSAVSVTLGPGQEPLVSYRLELYGVHTRGRGSAAFDADGVSVAGDEVPATGLAQQFAEQVSGLGGLRLTLVAPSYVEQGPHYRITAPAVQLNAALPPDPGHLVDHRTGVRVCTAAFSGAYVSWKPR
jgi:hypothetical protein